jgi:translation initiation factor IF-2
MAKIRVHELAKELNVQSKDIITYVKSETDADVKAMSALDETAEKKVRNHFASAKTQTTPAASAEKKDAEKPAKKKNISVVFSHGAGNKNGKRSQRSGQGAKREKNDRQQNAQNTNQPRPKKLSRRLMEAAAADRAKEQERAQRKEAQAAEEVKEQAAEETETKVAESKAVETVTEPVKKPIVRENIFDQIKKQEEAKKKAAAARKNEKRGDRNENDRNGRKGGRGDRNDRNGNGGNRNGSDRNGKDRGDRNNRNNRQDNRNSNNGNGQSRGNAAASAPKFDNSSNKPGRKGQDNKKNDYSKKDKRRGSRLDKSERTFSLEKTSGHKKAHKQPQKAAEVTDEIRTITLPEHMMLKDLADTLKIAPTALVKKLFLEGKIVTLNQEIDYEEAEAIALEYNCIAEPEEKVDVIEELLKEEEENEEDMVSRAPVVCVMGHVDHGKTSLLDAIRDTNHIASEAGGITQAIGAYMVTIDDRKITFLDTPGHEAFTAMRMRGANSTDIAVLVVAADDGVMPQTVEAINHAKAAGIEVIVAINKIDKPGANPERVKQELSEYELIPEDWGGSTVFVEVSAKTHQGIDDLLEMILLTADVLELKANPNRKARGLVIESKLDKGKGVCATVLVQKGTLRVGEPIAAGEAYGKVRAMTDENGRRVKEAGPSTPVEIQGLSAVPNAGEIFVATESDKEARNFAETFISEGRNRLLADTKSRMTLDDLFSQIQAGNVKELELIVKADVQGSVEALKQSLEKLSNEEVVVKIIHSGVGAINESDVVLATASNAVIIGFNVRPDAQAKNTADSEGVEIKLYNVIYNAIEDVEAAMKGMLDPIFEEKITGHVEIRQIFKASGVGNIAGSLVQDGVIKKDSNVRIFRGEVLLFEGKLASLKRYKDDVKEAKAGYECGIVVEGFDKFQEGDMIEAYSMVEVPR